MLILTIRTDKPRAEISLYRETKIISSLKWQADRKLADTIHIKIKELLDSQSKQLNQINGIVCFEGPGSFTGLRIGLSVGNSLAYGLNVPIVGGSGPKWAISGVKKIGAGINGLIVIPKYGSLPHITLPKH